MITYEKLGVGNFRRIIKFILCCLLGLLLTSPSAVQAQFEYSVNADNTISITGYFGPGGPIAVPASINGLFVTSIETNAFENLYLTSATIPGSITNIGEDAFEGCTSLTNVTISNGLPCIGENAFNFCGLTSITIPDSVTSIGFGAFSDCVSLTSVTIPGGVTNIDDYAFYYCLSLTSVKLPDGVTNIGEQTFSFCTKLTNVIMGDNVTSIGAEAFYYCTNLTKVTIPGGVTRIEEEAFAYCANLSRVYFEGNAPIADSTVFANGNNATVYYLPGTSGWRSPFAGRQSLLWNPLIQTTDSSFGVQDNQFGFNITGTPYIPILVEGCTNLAIPVWSSLNNVTLTNGLFYFSEPLQSNANVRFYRISSP